MPGRLLIVVVLLTLAVSGCGGSPEPRSAPSSPSGSSTDIFVTPDDRTQLRGTGYALRIPEGWNDSTDDLRALLPSVDRAGAQSSSGTSAATALTDSVAVFVRPAGDQPRGPAALARSARSGLQKVATQVKRLAATTIDGRRAAHHTGSAKIGNQRVQISQYYVVHGATATVVWFSFVATTPAEDRALITRSVLKSWRWTKTKGS
jgi:hypothetical protein